MPNDRRLLVKGREGFDSTDTDKNFSQKQASQFCTPLPITSSREVLITLVLRAAKCIKLPLCLVYYQMRDFIMRFPVKRGYCSAFFI